MLVKALARMFHGRLLVGMVSPAQLEIRKIFLESEGRNLEPPQVLVLPAGSASASQSVVFSGASLNRAEVAAARLEAARPRDRDDAS